MSRGCGPTKNSCGVQFRPAPPIWAPKPRLISICATAIGKRYRSLKGNLTLERGIGRSFDLSRLLAAARIWLVGLHDRQADIALCASSVGSFIINAYCIDF